MKVFKFNSNSNSNTNANFNLNCVSLLVKGQGIYVFNESDNKSEKNKKSEIKFTMYNTEKTNGLEIIFTNKSISVTRLDNKVKYLDPSNSSGLVNFTGAYYWFSLDSQNQIFYAGIGEPRIENVSFQYKFDKNLDPELVHKNKEFLESIILVQIDNSKPIKLIKDPITQKVPLKVVKPDELTMQMVSENSYMPIANLSLTSQQLYNCISGKNFVLNDNDFPDFSSAIEYSIRTPGLWCYEKLKQKSTEFNKDKPNELETYLRITLGQNNGESPGIPYVMEIWPPGHYSPIHSHAGAEAIIRVLNGEINVSLYPFLCGQLNGIKPFGNESFKFGEITWVSPGLNQTHQLKNLRKDITCVTIQCYMYDQENLIHYDYFDYINADGKIEHYEPDSDMDYLEFRNLMKKEWTDYLKSVPSPNFIEPIKNIKLHSRSSKK